MMNEQDLEYGQAVLVRIRGTLYEAFYVGNGFQTDECTIYHRVDSWQKHPSPEECNPFHPTFLAGKNWHNNGESNEKNPAN